MMPPREGSPMDRRESRLSRRAFVVGAAGLGLLVGCGLVSVPAQPPPKIARIGFLGLTTVVDDVLEAFRDGLRELGHVEGRTIAIEARWAESNEHLPALAVELVGMPVDLIVTAGGEPAQAAMDVTRAIPIVFTGSADPVRVGFVASLARPGGNVTGLSNLGAPLAGKRLQLLREMVPGVSPVMYLSDTGSAQRTGSLQVTQQAAESLGVQLLTPTVLSAADLPAALELAVVEHAELLVTGPLMYAERRRIVEFATAARLPLMAMDRSFAVAGGLSSYGPNTPAMYRRAAVYVDKILKGAKPADLPVEQPMRFDFVVNMKTAQALGITFPNEILLQVTEVIQ
jgi:putative ABC transport system substrate-binding protein